MWVVIFLKDMLVMVKKNFCIAFKFQKTIALESQYLNLNYCDNLN